METTTQENEGILAKLVEELKVDGAKIGTNLLWAVLTLVLGILLIRWVIRLLERIRVSEKMDKTVVRFLIDVVRVALYLVLTILVIGILGIPLTSVIALLTATGVTIGLALQGALSNLAGGLMLMIFRPFSVGDYVAVLEYEGNVKSITVMYTSILTMDNRCVTIPNGALMNASVENYSIEPLRAAEIIISTARGEDISKIKALILEVLRANPMVLEDPEPFVRLTGGNAEGMEFTVRGWTQTENYWELLYTLSEDVRTALTEAGIRPPAAVRIIRSSGE